MIESYNQIFESLKFTPFYLSVKKKVGLNQCNIEWLSREGYQRNLQVDDFGECLLPWQNWMEMPN